MNKEKTWIYADDKDKKFQKYYFANTKQKTELKKKLLIRLSFFESPH